jgi:hypothetical protein
VLLPFTAYFLLYHISYITPRHLCYFPMYLSLLGLGVFPFPSEEGVYVTLS